LLPLNTVIFYAFVGLFISMQALGPRDINRRPRRDAANNAKRKRGRAEIDYTIIQGRVHPGQAYSKAAEAQLDQDFPMFYKTE
jgi:hypothetical protein